MPIPIPAATDDVLREWETAIANHPKRATVRYGYAAALREADDPAGAVEQSSRALALNPKLHEAARLLAALLQRYELNAEIDISSRGLEAAFAFDDVDRQALSTAAMGLIKRQAPLAEILATGRAENWDAAVLSLLSKSGQRLLRDKLFRAVLTHGFNTDPETEELLTAFRRYLTLVLDRDRLRDRNLYDFACVLARQCANNEYVFNVTGDERQEIQQLERHLRQAEAYNGGDTDALLLLTLYGPVHDLIPPGKNREQLAKAMPRTLRDFLSAQWANRRKEDGLADSLLRLTDIADETSIRVANQYADDPYPRWLSMQTPEPGSARQRLEVHFNQSECAFLDQPYKVLIAGCGTGQQAVGSALGYGPNADVMAIDLSRRSLGYAARMAEHYKVENLRFAQADILGLTESGGMFDIIECVGVLHHMANPYDAWRILAERLRPGGLMLIGLYSAVSRQSLSALRSDAAWPGTDADDDALRKFRRMLMRRTPGEPGTDLLVSRDFYTKDGFRDLVLHVSEKQCSLVEVESAMKDNGLVFHGFQLPSHVLGEFLTRYPDDTLPGRLENWQDFEIEHPRTFDGMYNFWCRKA